MKAAITDDKKIFKFFGKLLLVLMLAILKMIYWMSKAIIKYVTSDIVNFLKIITSVSLISNDAL